MNRRDQHYFHNNDVAHFTNASLNKTTITSDIDAILYINASISLGIAFFAIFGNVILIFIYYKFKHIRNINNTVVTLLSISDFLRGSIVMTVKVYDQYASKVNLPPVACGITAVVCGFTFVFSPLILALIAFIRYGKIVGWKYKLLSLTKIKVYRLAFLAFFIAAIFSLLPYFNVGFYEYSIPHGVCFAPWKDGNFAFRAIFYALVVGIAFPILTVSYLKLYLVLRKHRKNIEKVRASSGLSEMNFNVIQQCNCHDNNDVSISNRELKIKIKEEKVTYHNQKVTYHNQVGDEKEDSNTYKFESNIAVVVTHTEKKKKVKCRCKKPQSSESQGKTITRQEYQVTKLMIMIFIAYCVCWLPAAVINVIALSRPHYVSNISKIIIVTMVDLKSGLDPIIYGFGNRQYRKAFAKLLE